MSLIKTAKESTKEKSKDLYFYKRISKYAFMIPIVIKFKEHWKIALW